MPSPCSFIQRCLEGEVICPGDEINNEIDHWHNSPEGLPPLHEWLGMSWNEYQLWAEKPWTLEAILAARKTGASLLDMVGAEPPRKIR